MSATVTRTSVIVPLRARTLSNEELRDMEEHWRPALLIELTEPAKNVTEPWQATAILFGFAPAPLAVERAQMLLARQRPNRAGEWLYAYHDARDPDTLIKIGGTDRFDPDERMAEHTRALGAKRGELTRLFAYPTHNYRVAEAVVHEMLAPLRPSEVLINSRTGHRVVEYFLIDDWVALGWLMKVVTRYTDATAG